MYLLIAFIILASIAVLASWLYITNKEKIRFYIEGIDQGFHSFEISTLWQVSQVCDLEEPVSLFYSMPSLTKCITQIKNHADTTGSANTEKMKNLLSKLYDFRTKIEKDADKKRGLESTRSLSNGQKLRIILPGKGVFSSEIVNNGRDITILVPTQKGQITVEGKSWINQTVNVYLWRNGDARYVFDTQVIGEGLFLGRPCLHLHHTVNLLRTQKRNAVRAKCHINAELYILKEGELDYNKVETKHGYKCVIEDISESGALIRIGGKGVPNVQLRLQYQLQNRLIIMFGIIRTVEYNEEIEQSRLHFECIHLDKDMKNQILSYVYNILPQNEKEIYDALSYTDADKNADENVSEVTKTDENGSFSEKISDEVTQNVTVYEANGSNQEYESKNTEENTINEDFTAINLPDEEKQFNSSELKIV